MKKTFIVLSLLSTVMGGVAQAAEIQALTQPTNANDENNDNRDDVTAGDDTNKATFSWSGTTLTVTGKGDLSKITVTDNNTKVFSAAGAGKVYTKSGETSTAVKQGDAYDSETKYYEPTLTYSDPIDPSTLNSWNENFSKATTFQLNTASDEAMHAIYWGDNGATAYFTVEASDASKISQNNNWDKKDNTGYYYWCVLKGTYSGSEYTLTLNMSDFKNGVYQGDGYQIILLDDNNHDKYGKTVTTLTASNDVYSKDANSSEYVYHAKGSSWEYTTGQMVYTASITVGDEPIADNDTYFGETHADYLTGAVLSFAEYLPHAVGSTYSTVIFKTDASVVTDGDNSKKAHISNEITRALVKCSAIETLNLQDTYLAELKNVDNSEQTDPTFYTGSNPGSWEQSVPNNETLKTLYMPCTGTETLKGSGSDNKTNRLTVFHYLVALKNLYLGEGIKTLGDHAISETGTFMSLETLTFPNSLEKAEADCMNGQTKVLTLTFPKEMKTIQRHAFWGTNPKDVFFLGTKAPEVAAFAWGENNYISNNAMTNDTIVGDTPETSIRIQKSTGVAVRQNYETRNGWYAMLHYPAACTEAEAARYTDLTRAYKKIVYGVENETFKKKLSGDDNDQGVMYYYYEAGKEETTLKGKGQDNDSGILGNVEASTFFKNIYSDGSYGGNYDGGYEDYYVGSQYIWPSMGQSQRACIVAENGVLWDGVTKIGEGIKAYDSEYTKDGSEYIGLHQFVFAQGDVTTDNTNEWDVTKYADGKWHSLCLPFDITKAKLEETFGPDAEGKYNYRVCKFNQVDRNEKNLKLYFNNEQYQGKEDLKADDVVIEGHVSYMVKLKKEGLVEGEKVMLKNYVMKEGSAVPTNVKVNEQAETNDDTKTANQYYFIGQYLSGVTIPQYSYFFSKSKAAFRFQGGTTGKWNAYSSVVEAPNGAEDNERYFSDGNSDSKLSTIWDEDETTGIDRVTIEAGGEVVYTNANVYNLNGQLVSTNGLQGLQKGIYVTNGKKVIVR